MDRSYSPVSGFYESHSGRGYAGKRRSFSSSSPSKILSPSQKKLHMTLGVVSVVLLILAIFFTFLLAKQYTADELDGMSSNMSSLILWVKSTAGKVVVAFLWGIGIISIFPIVKHYYNL